MAKQNLRKTMEQLLDQETEDVVLNPEHVNDWNYGKTSTPFKTIESEYPLERRAFFNIKAAISSPKSIRYRQMDNDFEIGKKGDYLFIDSTGNKMAIPYKLFKRLF